MQQVQGCSLSLQGIWSCSRQLTLQPPALRWARAVVDIATVFTKYMKICWSGESSSAWRNVLPNDRRCPPLTLYFTVTRARSTNCLFPTCRQKRKMEACSESLSPSKLLISGRRISAYLLNSDRFFFRLKCLRIFNAPRFKGVYWISVPGSEQNLGAWSSLMGQAWGVWTVSDQ